jgi:dolichol kinase
MPKGLQRAVVENFFSHGLESSVMSRLSTSRDLIQSRLPVSSSGGVVQPHLPEWVVTIPGVSRLVDRIGVTEFRRRIFHMSPALLPVALPFIPHPDVWGPILVTVMVLAAITALSLAIILGPLLMRRGEENWMHAVFGYIIPVVAGLLLFPGRSEWGLMTLQILALGDGSATLGGMTLGGRRLPWNQRKTFSGLFCFVIVGTLAATYSFWGEARPAVSVGSAFLICGVSAFCAGIAESLPIKSNDNLRVGATALLVGVIMSAIVL